MSKQESKRRPYMYKLMARERERGGGGSGLIGSVRLRGLRLRYAQVAY